MRINARTLLTQLTAAVLIAPAAYAGFQWVPPDPNPTAIPAPLTPMDLVQAPPVETGFSEEMVNVTAAPAIQTITMPAPAPVEAAPLDTPVMAETTPIQLAPYQPAPDTYAPTATPIQQWQPSQPQNQESLRISPIAQAEYRELSPLMPAPVPAPVPAEIYTPTSKAPTGGYPEAIGFGSDIPLVMALNQIIPSGYTYSFAQGVNPGALVSWSGGQAWNIVLNTMLAPLNLRADIAGNTVRIRPVGHSAASAQPRAAPLPLQKPQQSAALMPASATAMHTTHPVSIAVAEQQEKAAAKRRTQAQMLASQNPISLIKRRNITDPGLGDAPNFALAMVEPPQTPAASAAAIMPAAGESHMGALDFWEARKDGSLKETLYKWSARQNIRLIWESPYDYRINNNIMVNDSFRGALKSLMTQGLMPTQRPAMTFLEGDQNTPPTLIIRSAS